MATYYGGQIREEHRGNLALIITTPPTKNHIEESFLYEIGSEEYNHLTGPRAVHSPVIRGYIGVSYKSAETILRKIDDFKEKPLTPESFSSCDNYLVYSPFVNRST